MKKIIQKNNKQVKKDSLFTRIDAYCNRRHSTLLLFIIALNALLAGLFFDTKVSLSGDDSDYIMYAYNFAHDFTWPGFRGALYPILLSPFIALFGIRIVLLKALSALCILAMLYALYKALFKRIPSSVLFATLFLLSFNSYLLFYESQTFSEPLFMLLQTLLLVCFLNYFIPTTAQATKGKTVKHFSIIACIILLLALSRTVGYIAIGAVALYFLADKQWRNALYSLLITGGCVIVFNILKQWIWPGSGSSYSLSSYFAKDMYNLSKGTETFSGFIIRFIQNAEGYLSRDLVRFLGLTTATTTSMAITITLTVLFIAALIIVWKKSKPLFFTGLYALLLCGTHFILLQAMWQQERFMLVLYPFVLLLFLAAGYYTLQKYRRLQFLLPVIVGIIFIGTASHTITKMKRHLPVLKHNLRGDYLYGFTPDWQHFILMSEWAGKNLPKDAIIASRKPSISSIYGNRPFTGIYSVPGVVKDSLTTLRATDSTRLLAADIATAQVNILKPLLRYVISGAVQLNGQATTLTGVYEVDNALLNDITAALNANNLNYTDNWEQFSETIAGNNSILIYSPDALLAELEERNIRYMLLASLRTNQNANTGSIINTLQRYIFFINLKYPDIIKQECHKIGGNNEPATLIELRTEN